jgi:hypothetical protein
VDPSDDSPPPQGIGRDGDGHEGPAARRSEVERLPDRSNGFAGVLIRNNKLLHPGERQIHTLRKHPAVLGWNVFLTLAVLTAAGFVSTYITGKAGKNGNVTLSITLFHHVERVTGEEGILLFGTWAVYLLTVLYLLNKTFAWLVSYLVITDRQLILIAGRMVLRFASVRISEVTSWYLRESFGGSMLGYRSLVVKVGDQDGVVRTIGYVPRTVVEYIEEALPSDARYAGDEEAFKKWNAGGLRRRVRLVIAVLLICLLVVLAVAAAISPRIRTELSNETEIIALLPILIALIAPKS